MRLKTFFVIVVLVVCCGCQVQKPRDISVADDSTSSDTRVANDNEYISNEASADSGKHKEWELYMNVLDQYNDSTDNRLQKCKCVTLSNVISKSEWVDLIYLEQYVFSKKGYIDCGSVDFAIATYCETKKTENGLKDSYYKHGFIRGSERIKGYAVVKKRNGDILLIKCSDSVNTYYVLNKDTEHLRFTTGPTVSVSMDAGAIDEMITSVNEVNSYVSDLMSDLECVLIKDGVLDECIESELISLPDYSMSYVEASELCHKNAYKKWSYIDSRTFWKQYGGAYTTDSGDDDEKVNVTINDDGSFVGEYFDTITTNGVVGYASFSGTFVDIREGTDSLEFDEKDVECFCFKCDDFKLNIEKTPNDGRTYKCCNPDMLRDFSEFKLFKKGLDLANHQDHTGEVDRIWSWFQLNAYYDNKEMPKVTDRYIISNSSGEYLYSEL